MFDAIVATMPSEECLELTDFLADIDWDPLLLRIQRPPPLSFRIQRKRRSSQTDKENIDPTKMASYNNVQCLAVRNQRLKNDEEAGRERKKSKKAPEMPMVLKITVNKREEKS